MSLRTASLIPKVAASVADARVLVAEEGAARLGGFEHVEDVIALGHDFLAGRATMVLPQFATSKSDRDFYKTNVPRGVPDERGRTVVETTMHRDLLLHNDGKTFGDYAPEYIMLWCQVACPNGGESVLVDGSRLLEILATRDDDKDLVDFCWNVPIDVSEAHNQLDAPAPIARRSPRGTPQVRCHSNLRAVPGPDELAHQQMIDRWIEAVNTADREASTFRMEEAEVVIVDNYRLMHGRRAYTTPERRVVSTWAWTNDAFGTPDKQPDFNRPGALFED